MFGGQIFKIVSTEDYIIYGIYGPFIREKTIIGAVQLYKNGQKFYFYEIIVDYVNYHVSFLVEKQMYLSRCMTKPWTQRRLRSASAPALVDRSLRYGLIELLWALGFFLKTGARNDYFHHNVLLREHLRTHAPLPVDQIIRGLFCVIAISFP